MAMVTPCNSPSVGRGSEAAEAGVLARSTARVTQSIRTKASEKPTLASEYAASMSETSRLGPTIRCNKLREGVDTTVTGVSGTTQDNVSYTGRCGAMAVCLRTWVWPTQDAPIG